MIVQAMEALEQGNLRQYLDSLSMELALECENLDELYTFADIIECYKMMKEQTFGSSIPPG